MAAEIVYQVTPAHTSRDPKPATSHPRHSFKYAGRRWTLTKRSPSPAAYWHLEASIKGQRLRETLATASRTHAEAQAKQLIDSFLAGLYTRKRPTTQPARLADIIAIVPNLPITANPATRSSYVWSARFVLRLALDVTDAEIDELRADVLNKDLARRYFAAVMAKAGGIASQAERATWLRTATTFYDNARALFAPLPLDAMRETFKLSIPATIEDFRNGKKLCFREKIPAGAEFERPADSIIRATWREWLKLGCTPGYCIPTAQRHGPELSDLDRRNVFIAVGLMLSCGLRIGEVEKVRWDWLQTHNGTPLLCSDAVNVKNRSGQIRVKPLDPFWRTLWRIVQRNRWSLVSGQWSDGYVLAERVQEQVTGRNAAFKRGGQADRTEWPKILAAQWLRWLGWRTQKSNHALRDLAASWVTMKFGLERAKIFCRHGQQSTTEKHYGRFVDPDVMDDPRRLAWLTWSK